jgi:hypothetical protein
MEQLEAALWARQQFGGCQLGHAARLNRLARVATAMVQDPAASIPMMFGDRAQARAMYRFMANDSVSHASILAGSAEVILRACERQDRVVVVQDTTHVTLGGREGREDFGPVGDMHSPQGFLVHSAFVLDGQSRPLGVLAQKVWARERKTRGKETCGARKGRAGRESLKWLELAEQVDYLLSGGAVRPGVVNVFDAEGDTFEVLEKLEALGHGYVIRACRNRLIENDESDDVLLAEVVATARRLGSAELSVPTVRGRAGRTATLEIRSGSTTLMPPKNRNRSGESHEVNFVCVSEMASPADVEPLSWLLLTSDPVDDMRDCLSVIGLYKSRWIIEEFHMALKTGCSIEARQLQTFDAMTTLLAICNPIATHLLALRHDSRNSPERPASELLTPIQLKALKALRPKLPARPSIREAVHAIASLGGFLGRKSDGEPGWRTIWLGFRDVLLVTRALENSG